MAEAIDPLPVKSGIVATLALTDNGNYRLTLDDVSRLWMTDAQAWRHERLFTYKDFAADRLEQLKLSKDELAQIGENLIIRLLALKNSEATRGGYDVT